MYADIIWDLPDDPDGNVQQIAEHGFTQDDITDVLCNPRRLTTISRTSGNPITFGYTSAGEFIAVAWEHVDDDPLTIRSITAYRAPEPR